jgi:TENA/THI-4/PQQC family protein
MLQGFLRQSVEVSESGDMVSLAHPCWKLDLPRQWVSGAPDLEKFLHRRVTVSQVESHRTETGNLLRLLEAQGCLTFMDNVESYSLQEIRPLFTAIRNEWYGIYYRHPVWNLLRQGSLSKNGLVTWLIYNYFLSRSAGNSSARFATRSKNPAFGRTFYREALEEYSHFSDYYFLHHAQLNLPDAAVDRYVQLPASQAFCQQMLRMAETDWLAYILIAFFQESTIQFSDDCRTFYNEVEKSYGLKHLFDPWWKHIELDIEFTHAKKLEKIFEADERVSTSEVIRSLTSAWIAFRFLVLALDQITVEGQRDTGVLLRSPVTERILDPASNALVKNCTHLTKFVQLPVMHTAHDVYTAMSRRQLIGKPETGRDTASADVKFLRLDLVRSIYRALSYAETGGEVVALGRIAECAFESLSPWEQGELGNDAQPATAEAMALANFVCELATHPGEFCFVIHSVASARAEWSPLGGEKCTATLTNFLSGLKLDAKCCDGLITKQLQLNEHLRNWQIQNLSVVTSDFFWGNRPKS